MFVYSFAIISYWRGLLTRTLRPPVTPSPSQNRYTDLRISFLDRPFCSAEIVALSRAGFCIAHILFFHNSFGESQQLHYNPPSQRRSDLHFLRGFLQPGSVSVSRRLLYRDVITESGHVGAGHCEVLHSLQLARLPPMQ